MLWNERRASSRRRAMICWSMSSIFSLIPGRTQRIALERAPQQRNHKQTTRENEEVRVSTQSAKAPAAAVIEDHMPLHGIDHVELFVGNAAQAAHYYAHAFGFREVAYAGLHTGVRDRASHVLVAGAHPPRAHGRADARPRHRPPRRAPRRRREGHRALGPGRGARLPHGRRARRARRARAVGGHRRARHGAPGDHRHLRRDAAHLRRAGGLRRRRSCPATRRARTPRATPACSPSTTSSATSSSARWTAG